MKMKIASAKTCLNRPKPESTEKNCLSIVNLEENENQKCSNAV